MQNFEKIIGLLVDNDVQFVLIGGLAAAMYGVTIVTQDIDICVPFNIDNVERIIKALKSYHPVYNGNKRPMHSSPEYIAQLKNLYLLTDLGAIDMLSEVKGLGRYPDLVSHSVEIDLFGRKCKVLDIESLIISKKEFNRPKDKETVIQLVAIKGKMRKT